jgi:hypothetical protein
MPRTIRFHLDENCPRAVATGLRRRGIQRLQTNNGLLLYAWADHGEAPPLQCVFFRRYGAALPILLLDSDSPTARHRL